MDDAIKKLPIPEELVHPFFFSQEEIVINKPIDPLNIGENFIYELFYYNGIETIKPWKIPQESIPMIVEKWRKIKEHLNLLHHNREQESILESMKTGVGMFIQLLFWSNEEPVNLMKPISISQLSSKPVNVQERLDFIIARPKLSHSFIQLSELMIEQEKHFIKKIVVKKASRPKV
jgi:hypothetical protein